MNVTKRFIVKHSCSCLQQQRKYTVHSEELPYLLGAPLDGTRGRYDIGETLFSEAIMNWWCSFAYIG